MNMTNPSTTLQLGPGESVLPLECSIIQGRAINGDEDDEDDDDYNDGHEDDSSNNGNNNGKTSKCIGVSRLLQVESRGLQSASWFALESQAGPGIFESGNGGLEFRVTFKNGVAAPWRTATIATATTATTATATNSRNVFWIRIESPHSSIVSLAIGPYVVPSSIPPHKTWLKQRSRPRSQSPRSNEEAIKVVRPFDITSHQSSGEPARILLITESHNYMPQGRVWDSAFVLLEFFKNRVAEGIRRRSSPVLAGKKILDLSAGTGLLGLYLAGLAEVELQSNNSTALTPPTSVVMTDLDDAMDLIGYNISSNRMLAVHVDISAQRLKWKTPFRATTNLKDLDVVIASDVIYDEKAFESLLSTLVGLCSPGRTEIYLGYKRRQLSPAKELEFFSKIKNLFHVEELEKEPVHELGVKVYRLSQG
ncbi:Methyltransferase-like protein 21D [Linnemannia exigua]|uniref:Methyltransferase-like protein 21D n=1 Tax=Linnemannia exigua TaxID=604196 RepID=A0AAD4DJ22_9FUNG|nr:Methyltransferase-like protein 21D [Linnemannia exigua]